MSLDNARSPGCPVACSDVVYNRISWRSGPRGRQVMRYGRARRMSESGCAVGMLGVLRA